MISTNALSVFIFHHHQKVICKKNLCSIQEIMRTSDTAFERYKKVYNNLPSIVIPTKSVTPGKVQQTFANASVENKSLEESVVEFALAGSLDSPSVIFIDINILFAMDSDKIRLPITEVLLCAAATKLARPKKQQYWTPHNAALLPPFLTEVEILDGGADMGELLEIFAHSFTKRAKEGEKDGGNEDSKKI